MIGLCFALGLALAASGPPTVVKKAAEAENARASAALLVEAQAAATVDELPWLLLYASEYQRLAGDTGPARDGFTRVAADFASHPAREPAKVGLAVINAEGHASGNTLATLDLITEAGVPGTLNADRWLLVAQSRVETSEPARAREALRRAEASARGTKESRRVQAAVDALRAKLGPVAPAPKNSADKRPSDLAAIELIRAKIASGALSEVGPLATSFGKDYADSPFAREATYAADRASRGTLIHRNRIAVVLPLTGEYAIPGGQLRAAIELSAQVVGGLEVVVQDTGGKAEGCSKAVEKAVLESGAAIVLGPLTKDESLGCAATAQALHTPMLSFTSAEDVVAIGDQVFRPYPTVSEQIGALLDDMMGGRGWSRFAIINPKTPFGEGSARTFQALVEARGGAIAAHTDYDPSATDFRSVGKVLGKKDYKARASEYWAAQADAKRNGGDPTKATLRPIIDYDAVFVPDGYRNAALLAAALAFEEFPIGGFRPRRDDIPLGLVGLNAWNNPEWPRRGGDYVGDSIFVDAFFLGDRRAVVADFVERWEGLKQGDVSVVAAVGWDTVRVAAAALKAEGADVASNLLLVDVVDPVSGLHGFTPERTARRDWTLLTVRNGAVAPLYLSDDGQ
ncbi:hypothetical protein LBMAG42_38310 [Deltaproteobacteria bacterium]|nr:hypothetical protein LBMAG42_38310 [Deltaproteobacteria bacterium]